MASLTKLLPETEAISPADQAGAAEAVRAAHDAQRAVYPLGGRTALNYGIAPTRPGIGLDLSGLNRIVDYTPRDMTIVVEAGVRMADLARTLAAEGQQLPIDVPRAAEATIGGVVATNWNGPRRYGYGTIRDYVIGIHAVDGRGVAFKGGGRVVKNVAGYDFCKLLTGSLGTLAVITQLALKLKPLAEQSATIVGVCDDPATLESILDRLSQLEAMPVAIDVLAGRAWGPHTELRAGSRAPSAADGRTPAGSTTLTGVEDAPAHRKPYSLMVAVRVEGSEEEVDWLVEQVQSAIASGGGRAAHRLGVEETDALWNQQVEFSDRGLGEVGDASPLVLKFAVPPSAVTAVVDQLLTFDADCAIRAHAGNGIVVVRFTHFSQADLTAMLVGKLRPAAMRLGGTVVVVSSTMEGLTPHMIWGGRNEADLLVERIKQKFDPNNILNPGRFVL
jgi:glycolate oxidase FAD binding subunit